MPSVSLQISGLILLLIAACSRTPEVSIRKHPYPYLATLAISSDCDRTDDADEFLTLMRYLNTPDSTVMGPGLDLEIGYSFWFFDALGSSRFTVFIDTSFEMSSAEPVIKDFIRAGYIDFLHTYGEFSLGGFRREFAESAVSYLRRNDLKILTWINHGPPTNCENVGELKFQLGDNPETPCYHLDLLKEAGFIFFGLYDVTHIVGQDRAPGFIDVLKGFKDASIYFLKLRTSRFKSYLKNSLIEFHVFDDGDTGLRFVRFISKFGEVERTCAGNLYRQISPDVLNELEENHGFMIVYTHLGDNAGPPEYFNDSTKAALAFLAREFHGKRLLVATTTRLLKLSVAVNFLDWELLTSDDSIFIKIKGVKGIGKPDKSFYDGLTFYTPSPERTEIFIYGKRTEKVNNPPDESGRRSVSIPWKRLKFPSKYRLSIKNELP